MAPPGCETATFPFGDTVCVFSVTNRNASEYFKLEEIEYRVLGAHTIVTRAYQQVLGWQYRGHPQGSSEHTPRAMLESRACATSPALAPRALETSGQSHSCSPGSSIKEPLPLLLLLHCFLSPRKLESGHWNDAVEKSCISTTVLDPQATKKVLFKLPVGDCGGQVGQFVVSASFT